jgi:predicted anti-sigma-YlaC factor YlaD
MRCKKCERLISDRLDGALGEKSGRRLADHLAVCPSCRDYAVRLKLIQDRAAGGQGVRVSNDYLEDFSARVRARLESLEVDRPPQGRSSRIWKWAWMAVPLAAAAAFVFLEVGRREPAFGPEFLTDEGYLGSVGQAVGDNADLAVDLNALVLGALQDEIGTIPPEEAPVLTDDPAFWEGLSDDEASQMNQEILKEIKS